MKFQILSAAVAGLALAACGGGEIDPVESAETADEAVVEAAEEAQEAEVDDVAELEADCLILASDPEAQESFVDMGTDTEGFCECFVDVIDNSPEEERAQMLITLEEVTDGMEASGEGAEDVVSRMMSAAMTNAEGEAAQGTMAGVRMIGDVIDRIDNSMEDTGTCPAA